MTACLMNRQVGARRWFSVCLVWFVCAVGSPSLLCAQSNRGFARKNMPKAQTFRALFGPNYSYPYLRHASRFPFPKELPVLGQPPEFDRVHAWWLAEISMLVYADGDGFVRRQLMSAGMLDVKMYTSPKTSADHTQAILTFNADSVIVAFRGTEPNEWKDLITDMKAHQIELGTAGKVHAGFQSGLLSVWDQVQPELERLSASGKRVWMTGHSLGGALAVLAAHQFREPATVYTFGSPRIGDADFVKHYQQPTFRIVNNTDLVAEVPPPLWYQHVGELIYFNSRHQVCRNVPVSRLVKDRARGQSLAVTQRIKEWSSLDLAERPVKPLLDHAPICYVVHCWNAMVEQLPVIELGPDVR
ncbi:MAG: hypothetical protein CMM01_20900 [Rhodopirellula sp.]|nr:hypothetical protein [Rhodopirellula sp.]